jgi:hypothetical protein
MPARTAPARAAVAAAIVVGAVVLSGCGASTPPQQPIPLASAWHPGLFVDGYGPAGLGPTPTASPSASTTGSTTASPTASDTSLTDPTQAMLATLLLQAGDVPSGLKVVLDDQGSSLSVATLTYCAGSYASESSRQARRRDVVETTAGVRTGIATEAVLYATAADAEAALSELRGVSSSCPSPRTVTSGSSKLVFTAVPSTDVDATGFVPDADRVMVSTTVDDGTGAPYRVTRLWQRRGRVLVALYYSGATIAAGSTATFTTQDLGNVKALGTTLAQRLAALEPAVVATP